MSQKDAQVEKAKRLHDAIQKMTEDSAVAALSVTYGGPGSRQDTERLEEEVKNLGED